MPLPGAVVVAPLLEVVVVAGRVVGEKVVTEDDGCGS